MSSGRVFQSLGPATANDQSPTVTSHDRALTSSEEVDDQRRRLDVMSAQWFDFSASMLLIETSQFNDQAEYVEMVWHGERKDDNNWIKCCMKWEVEELDREDARKRPDGIMLRMTWKV